MSEPTFICTRCHSEIPMPDRREFGGRDYCPRCLDAITAVCHICGTRFTLTNNHGTEDTPLCEDCLHTHNAKGICEHSFKPTPIFYGKGPRYFGVELEIDDGGELDENANEILSAANAEREYIYIKHDGSLDDGKGGGRNRYSAVNLTNTDTVEFRLFRGTLKLNTFLATLQLLDRICDVAINMSDSEIKDMPWTTFVSGCTAPELVQYLKERRLYVNDPVELAEEEE